MFTSNPNSPLSQPEAFATLHPNLLIGIHRALIRLAAQGQVSGGGYYEFGLYRGFSFWYACNLAHDLGLKLNFHGFDSFEGLPPSEIDNHRNWQPCLPSKFCRLNLCLLMKYSVMAPRMRSFP